jgi:hypothetical protein
MFSPRSGKGTLVAVFFRVFAPLWLEEKRPVSPNREEGHSPAWWPRPGARFARWERGFFIVSQTIGEMRNGCAPVSRLLDNHASIAQVPSCFAISAISAKRSHFPRLCSSSRWWGNRREAVGSLGGNVVGELHGLGSSRHAKSSISNSCRTARLKQSSTDAAA